MLKRFLRAAHHDRSAGAIEYGIIAALAAVLVIRLLSHLG